MSWTPDRVEALTRLWTEGFSATQIAAELGGTTRNAVIGRVHRMKLPKRQKVSTPRAVRVRPRSRSVAAVPRRPAVALPRPPAPVPSPSLPAEEAVFVEPTPLHLSVMGTSDRQCKFMAGDPKRGGRFCGTPVWRPGSAWCSYHRRIVYRPVDERRRDRPADLAGVRS